MQCARHPKCHGRQGSEWVRPQHLQVLAQLQSVCDIHAPRVIEEFIADKQLKDKSRRVPTPSSPLPPSAHTRPALAPCLGPP